MEWNILRATTTNDGTQVDHAYSRRSPIPPSFHDYEYPNVTGFDNSVTQAFGPTSKSLQVKLAHEPMLPKDGHLQRYCMLANPRGYALVINNIFDESSKLFPGEFDRRYGAENDHVKLSELLQQLYFKVEVHIDRTSTEIYSIIDDFANKNDWSEMDCACVIIMSHGTGTDNDTLLLGTDGCFVSTEAIYKRFLNSRCKKLIDKPKFFIFQACRGDDFDEGVDKDIVQRNKLCRGISTISVDSTSTDGLSQQVRTNADIFMAFPVPPGLKANRNPKSGAWFIQTLVNVFSECSFEHDLDNLMKIVDLRLSRKGREKLDPFDNYQSVTITQIGWSKQLYFNPGIYLHDGKLVLEYLKNAGNTPQVSYHNASDFFWGESNDNQKSAPAATSPLSTQDPHRGITFPQNNSRVVVAIETIKATGNDELSLEKGAEYEVVETGPYENFLRVRDASGAVGRVPPKYVQEKEYDLSKYRWFVGKLSKEETETMLMRKKEEGSFVVRDSITCKGAYTLACYVNDPLPRVKNYLIMKDATSVALLIQRYEREISSLLDLLVSTPATLTDGSNCKPRSDETTDFYEGIADTHTSFIFQIIYAKNMYTETAYQVQIQTTNVIDSKPAARTSFSDPQKQHPQWNEFFLLTVTKSDKITLTMFVKTSLPCPVILSVGELSVSDLVQSRAGKMFQLPLFGRDGTQQGSLFLAYSFINSTENNKRCDMYSEIYGKPQKTLSSPTMTLGEICSLVSYDDKIKYLFQCTKSRRNLNLLKIEIVDNIFDNSFDVIHSVKNLSFQTQIEIKVKNREDEDPTTWVSEICKRLEALQIIKCFSKIVSINLVESYPKRHLTYLQFFGRCCGLCLNQNKPLNFCFSRAFYKMMLGKSLQDDDLEESYFADPKILEAVLRKGRKAGNEEDELARLYSERVQERMKAFIDGFTEIIPLALLRLFNEIELKALCMALD